MSQRAKDCNWTIPDGIPTTFEAAQLAVLMDLRDELKKLNSLLSCPNFLASPGLLRAVKARTGRIPVIRHSPRRGRK